MIDRKFESAINIVFEQFHELFDPWWDLPSREMNVPLHVTLLWPWYPPPIPQEGIELLHKILQNERPFDVTFNGIEMFANGTIYISLKDELKIKNLMKKVFANFPTHPPYEGEFPDPTPHMSISAEIDLQKTKQKTDKLREVTKHIFPIHARVDSVHIQQEKEGGRWETHTTIPLS